MEQANPGAEPQPSPQAEVTGQAIANDLEADLQAAINAANEEARQAAAVEETATSSAIPAQDGPRSGETAAQQTPDDTAGGEPAPVETAPDDDEPNPALPKLTKGETKRLFEQWEAERRPLFFREAEEKQRATQAEADRLRAESEQRATEEAARRAETDDWLGPEQEFQARERAYDGIVGRLERNEYVPDEEIAAAREFSTWRDRRRFEGALTAKAYGKLSDFIDRSFRSVRADGVDVVGIIDAVDRKRGTPAEILQTAIAAAKEATAAEWKTRHEADTKKLAGQLAAEKAAHEATRQKFGLGRAATGESGGTSVGGKGDVVALLTGRADDASFVERALRGEFAGVNLSD